METQTSKSLSLNKEQENDLYLKFNEYFSEDNLREIVFLLDINYDDLPGNTKKRKVQELIQDLNRQGRISELRAVCVKKRDHVDWPIPVESTMETKTQSNKKSKDFKQVKSKSNWQPWGDHPATVVIATIAGLIAIVIFITGQSDLRSLLSYTATPSSSENQLIEHEKFSVAETLNGEYERLQIKDNIYLGAATSQAEDVISKLGVEGSRQWFENGVIYTYDDQVFAIYGPVYEHYITLDQEGNLDKNPYSPLSQLQKSTSISGEEIYKMEFEKVSTETSNSEILASSLGSFWLEGWIRSSYYNEYGGYDGWLGLPISDLKNYGQSDIQAFENGYMVYTAPYTNSIDTKDWNIPPVAFPYLGSRGNTIKILSDILWQDTDIDVEEGDQINIVQLSGEWENFGETSFYDANGDVTIQPSDDALLPSFPIGFLVGRVGENGLKFPVGRWSTITAKEGGRLYLSINDTQFDDNVGAIVVQVIVDPSD